MIARMFLAATCAVASLAAGVARADGIPERPVSTYSIVARDASTGELGVAVQSHWFSVGSVVAWAEAGVGAVATQSFVEVSYGPRGLESMRDGLAAGEALRRLREQDPHAEVRQVAFVDAAGRTAVFTGERCIPMAGHRKGDGYTIQANLMLTEDVPEAMERAYLKADGPLAERLLAALEAGQQAGGDIRGMQSAALLVVRGNATDRPWTDRLVDLRVEDDPDPLGELARLLRLHRAYEKMNVGDEAVAAGDMERALERYTEAERMFPDNDEFVFWHAVTLVTNGRVDQALPLFDRAFRMNPNWVRLVPRLVRVGQLPDDPAVTERILALAPPP